MRSRFARVRIRRFITSALLLLGMSAGGRAASYVVLQSNGDLIRLPSDGSPAGVVAHLILKPDQLIAGLAQDASGDYIAATGAALLRISRLGTITKIADAPTGALWTAVAVARTGNLIVGDGDDAILWSAAPDGSSVHRLAAVDPFEACCMISIIPADADYIVIIDSTYPQRTGIDKTRMLRVSAAGQVMEIKLSGEATWCPAGAVQVRNGDIYFTAVVDSKAARAGKDPGARRSDVYKVTLSGEVSRVAGAGLCNADAVAASPTGEHVVALSMFCGTLFAVGADVQLVDLLHSRSHLILPIAVLVDDAK